MMSDAKENPVVDLDPVPDAWVVNGCRTSVDFWQMCLPLPPVPHGQDLVVAVHPADGGEQKVVRGFDNLLHWLDWFDSVHGGMQRGENP